MALHYYRRTRLEPAGSDGAQIWQLLMDVKSVYPGCGQEGLKLKEIGLPTAEDMGIESLMPPSKSAEDKNFIPFNFGSIFHIYQI